MKVNVVSEQIVFSTKPILIFQRRGLLETGGDPESTVSREGKHWSQGVRKYDDAEDDNDDDGWDDDDDDDDNNWDDDDDWDDWLLLFSNMRVRYY